MATAGLPRKFRSRPLRLPTTGRSIARLAETAATRQVDTTTARRSTCSSRIGHRAPRSGGRFLVAQTARRRIHQLWRVMLEEDPRDELATGADTRLLEDRLEVILNSPR